MFLFLLYFLIGPNLNAEESSYTIVVEERYDYEVYVVPTRILNASDYEISYLTFSYENLISFISSYKNISKYNDNGIKKPISISDRELLIYGKDTIQYSWDNCDYKRNHKSCSGKNGNYYAESVLTVTNSEISFVLSLYDRNHQLISKGVSVSKVEEKYTPKIIVRYENNPMTGANSVEEEITYEKDILPPSVYLSDLRKASHAMWIGAVFK
jgi:hypothetical protein